MVITRRMYKETNFRAVGEWLTMLVSRHSIATMLVLSWSAPIDFSLFQIAVVRLNLELLIIVMTLGTELALLPVATDVLIATLRASARFRAPVMRVPSRLLVCERVEQVVAYIERCVIRASHVQQQQKTPWRETKPPRAIVAAGLPHLMFSETVTLVE